MIGIVLNVICCPVLLLVGYDNASDGQWARAVLDGFIAGINFASAAVGIVIRAAA